MRERTASKQAMWGPGEGPLLQRRRRLEEAEMDITPMIDCTFLLLVFFMVTSALAASDRLDLPRARYGSSVAPDTAVIFSLVERGAGEAEVYLTLGDQRQRLDRDPARQAEAVRGAVQAGLAEGKRAVLVKAERGIAHREVARVAEAAGQVEGITLHLAVTEAE